VSRRVTKRAMLIALFERVGGLGLTCDEADQILGGFLYVMSAHVARFAKEGVIIRTARCRPTQSNRKARVYVIAGAPLEIGEPDAMDSDKAMVRAIQELITRGVWQSYEAFAERNAERLQKLGWHTGIEKLRELARRAKLS
jgi:hypothetical protein